MVKTFQVLLKKTQDEFWVVLAILIAACAIGEAAIGENPSYVQPLHKRTFPNTRGRLWGESREIRILREQAEQGDAKAQCHLGMLYATGRGVRRNFEEARKWVTRAAEQGFAEAQCILGGTYRTGQGAPRNDTEAAKWYRCAAEQGVCLAQYNLGQLYMKGEGVLQDFSEAAKWFRCAAEQGLAAAQFNIGLMHAEGAGVPQDKMEALIWLTVAYNMGDPSAEKHIGQLTKAVGITNLPKSSFLAAKRQQEIERRMQNQR